MEFSPLVPESYPALAPFFADQPHELSVFSLASVAIWRREDDLSIGFAVEDGVLHMRAESRSRPEDRHLALPLPTDRFAPADLARLCSRVGCARFGFVPESYIAAHGRTEVERFFAIEARPEYDDYLYRTEDLASLPGRHFSAKRAHARRFERDLVATGHAAVEILSPASRPEYLEFLEAWSADRGAAGPFLPGHEDEMKAARLAVEEFDLWGMEGVAVRVDGRVAGIAIASRLTRSMAVLNVEKASAGHPGLYQFLDRELARRIFLGRYEFVNKESDMGLPGLRKMKESYRPVRRVRCFSLRAL